MNTSLKLMSALSAVLLLAACENAGDGMAGNDGAGYGAGNASEYGGDPAVQADLERNVGDRVFFGYDSAVLDSEAQSVLNGQAAWLKQNPNVNVIVEGHCDERGTREYNIALGERRASAAKSYLVAAGVDSSRVDIISYGKERPAVVGSNDSSWSQNRRSVTVVAK